MSTDPSLADLRSNLVAHRDPHFAAVQLFLSRRPEGLRRAFEAAAIPHWFDDRILGEMLQVEASEAKVLVEALVRLSFVDRFPIRSGWRVHESVRQPFREDLLFRHPDAWVRLSRRALVAFDPERSAVDLVEHVFHRICADPDRGSKDIRRWVRWIVERGRTHETHFLGRVLEEIAQWGDRWPALPARVWLSLASAKFGSASSRDLQSWADEAFRRLGAEADSVDRADAHELLGRVHRVGNRNAEALAEFRHAAEILERLASENDGAEEARRDLANLMIEMGRTLLTLGQTEDALRAFSTSREMLAARVAGRSERTPSDWRFGLAVAYNGIGEVLLKVGKTEESLEAIGAYRAIMADLAKEDPENSHWQRDLAVATFCEGELQRVRGREEAALDLFRTASQLLEQLSNSDPANARWLRDLSEAHNASGMVNFARRDLPAALGDFLASRSIRERLLARDPGNTDWKRDLGTIHNNLGRVYEAQGRLAEAQAEYRADLVVTRELADAASENAESQRDLSVCLLNLGRICRALGRVDQAEASVREALRIHERWARSDPRNVEWQRDRAIAEKEYGECLEALGRREEAVAALSRAQALFTTLVTLDPSSERWGSDLERVEARLAQLGRSGSAPAAR